MYSVTSTFNLETLKYYGLVTSIFTQQRQSAQVGKTAHAAGSSALSTHYSALSSWRDNIWIKNYQISFVLTGNFLSLETDDNLAGESANLTVTLVPQGGSQKSKVKSQKALILGFLAVFNGKFISADLC